MCIHSLKEESRCKQVLYRVKKQLKTDDKTLLSAIIYGLEWGLDNDCRGWVEFMGADQWAGITVKVYQKDKEIANIFVQCDHLEHGLARAWELAVEASKKQSDILDPKPGPC